MEIIIYLVFILLLLALFGKFLFWVVCNILKTPKIVIPIALAVFATPVLIYWTFETLHRLSFFPQELNVGNLIFANEESWGFGPGGNETGIIVYELPDDVAKKIEKNGINFLNGKSPDDKETDQSSKDENWQQTPILQSDEWIESEGAALPKKPNISGYLGKYGFSIDIDSRVRTKIDSALEKNGSYFHYTSHGGVLMIIPRERMVLYAYHG